MNNSTTNRLTTTELATKARITFNAHGHDYLSYKEGNYIDRCIAQHRTAFGGSFSTNDEIIQQLANFPLLTVVKHHFRNNNTKVVLVQEWKKVAKDAWVTV